MYPEILIVCAGTYEQFRDYVKRPEHRGVNIRFIYPHSPSKLMGILRCSNYVVVGTWCNRDDKKDIERILRERQMVEVFDA